MIAAGLLRCDEPEAAGFAAPRDLGQEREIVRLASALREHGIDWRHLRSMRAAADRQLAIIEQSVAPLRTKSTTSAQAHAQSVATELSELCGQLHTIWLRSGAAQSADQ